MDDWDLVSSDTPPQENVTATSPGLPERRDSWPPVSRRPGSGSLFVKVMSLVGVGLVLVFSGFGIFNAVSTNTANSLATATAQTEAIDNSNATATAQVNATATTSIPPSSPTIISVSQFMPVQYQTITILGKGFGIQAPYTNSTSNYLSLNDVTDSNWQAGYGYDWVKMSVSVWTDNQIVITGFSGYYGKDGFIFRPSDTVTVSVWNAQSGAGPAQFSLVVES